MTPRALPRRRTAARHAAGFTLVELLVAVTIGLALVLAVTLMLTRYESGRRSMTALNDSSIGGAYVSYLLDRTVRSAGSGFMQSWLVAGGCRVLASRSGTDILPSPGAFPAPFASVGQTVRLAPVVVHAGAGTDGSDVLAVLTGSSGLGETPIPVQPGSVTASELRIPATVGLAGGDLVMVYQDRANCLIQEIEAGFAGAADQELPLDGTYADADIAGVALNTLGATEPAFLVPLGSTGASRPLFQLIGVAANATLVSYDLLRIDGTDTVTPIADGVADLRVLYGVDTSGDGRVDSWQSPAAAGWTAAELQDGSELARVRLGQILALRIGLITRTQMPEREAVSPASLVLFDDLGEDLRIERDLSDEERLLRWRTLDFTVPLRNSLLLTP